MSSLGNYSRSNASMGKKHKRASVRNAKPKKAGPVPRTLGTLPSVRQPSGRPPRLPPRLQLWISRARKRVFPILSALGVVASIVAAFPRFSVAPGAPLKPTDVLSTPFLVTYDGWLPLRQVTYSCSLDFVESEGPNILGQSLIRTSEEPRSLYNGDAQTASCNGDESALSPALRLGRIRTARVAIIVEYSPILMPFFRRDQVFPFATVSQSDGILRFVRRLE
jgi:hypothetical protein